MTFFSIVTICRNNLDELKRTYDSINGQTIDDFEWVVADGNSTDGTKEWLKTIKSANWISEPDSGIFNAMNKGLKRARGKYMIFMNSGDCFAAYDVLENVKNKIIKSDFPDFVYGDSLDIDEQKNEYYRKAKNVNKNWMGMITQHQSMFFSQHAVKDISYNEKLPITADYAFISQVIKNTKKDKILKLDIPVCKFDMGGTNEQHRFKALKEDFQTRKSIIKLPYLLNILLYSMHYLHTILKRINPSVRFYRHKKSQHV